MIFSFFSHILGSILLFTSGCMTHTTIPAHVRGLFPTTPTDLAARAESALAAARSALRKIVNTPPDQRSFSTIFRALDHLGAELSTVSSTIHALQMIHPDESMRTVAAQKIIEIRQFTIDELAHNEGLYRACTELASRDLFRAELTTEQRLFVEETLRDFRRSGFDLDREQRLLLAEKEKALSAVALDFETTINTDRREVLVDEVALAGLDSAFIAALQTTPEGKKVLTTDYPIVSAIMESCSVGATREALSRAYAQVAYPKNSENLAEMVRLRDEHAHILGYPSAAAYDCETAMVKTPERAQQFLDDLVRRVRPKLDAEIATLKAELPEGVTLDEMGRIYPWDWLYIKAQYKKKHHTLDEQRIAEYFPAEHTLQGLLSIYEKFFDCRFIQIPASADSFWHPSVRLIEARRATGELLGHLLLDLYPRTGKYTHACQMTLVPALALPDGVQPAVALVIANFPAESADRPALLKHRDVTTFFHEFGHAIHALIGATTLAGFSGTRVKTDFVELPSQVLEEWMYDPAMLRMVSCHYQSGEPLPQETIEQIRAARLVDQGDWIVRQVSYSLLSLGVYAPGAHKDIDALKKSIHERCRFYMAPVVEHGECSFGHLTGYGALYYSYLWSKIFALDLFATINREGLINPAAGLRYAQAILAPGGSKDPEDMLREYLGREPHSDTFFTVLGITAEA
jgi:thimet oligopeptidase